MSSEEHPEQLEQPAGVEEQEHIEEAVEDHPRNEGSDYASSATGKRRRRQSLNNPKIKPRQTEAENSNLAKLAKQAQELNAKAGEYSDSANQILQPKNNFINMILNQHFLNMGMEDTTKIFTTEMSTPQHSKAEKVELSKTKQLRAAVVEALKIGDEKLFFDNRKSIHEELNYYVLDCELSLELELKTRVYFAVFFLIMMEDQKLDPQHAKKLTKERLPGLKSFFVEKGSQFAEDDDLKEYLKLPFLIENMPHDNQLLNFILSKDFAIQVTEENLKELDKIILLANRVGRHRSLITKVYEFYVKYHPEATNSPIHQQVYDAVETSIQSVQADSEKYNAEEQELDGLLQRLQGLTNATKDRFVQLNEQRKKDQESIKPQILDNRINIVQVGHESRSQNADYRKKWEEVTSLEKELHDLREKIAKSKTEKTHEDYSENGYSLYKQFLPKKLRLLELKLKKLNLELKKPMKVDKPAEKSLLYVDPQPPQVSAAVQQQLQRASSPKQLQRAGSPKARQGVKSALRSPSPSKR